MRESWNERSRGIVFLMAMVVAFTTLWTVAWSRSIEDDVDRGWLPALKVPGGRDGGMTSMEAVRFRNNAGAGMLIENAAEAEEIASTQPSTLEEEQKPDPVPAVADLP